MILLQKLHAMFGKGLYALFKSTNSVLRVGNWTHGRRGRRRQGRVI